MYAHEHAIVMKDMVKIFIVFLSVHSWAIEGDVRPVGEEKGKPDTAEAVDEKLSGYEGFHLQFFGVYGMSMPHATLSNISSGFPPAIGTKTAMGVGTLFYLNSAGALTFKVSTVTRELGLEDDTGYLKVNTKFIDMNFGYRVQGNWLYGEFGILYGLKLSPWTAEIKDKQTNQSVSGELSSVVSQKDNLGIYVQLGLYKDLSDTLFLDIFLQWDLGFVNVIEWPLTTGGSDNLVAYSLNLGGGLGFRF